MGIVYLLEMYLYLYNLVLFYLLNVILHFLLCQHLLVKRKPKGSQEQAIQEKHPQRPTSKTMVNVAYVPSFL